MAVKLISHRVLWKPVSFIMMRLEYDTNSSELAKRGIQDQTASERDKYDRSLHCRPFRQQILESKINLLVTDKDMDTLIRY